ncbi:pentatricopeptide repeat-containing protein At1g53600, mitochondrial [Dioscorea cayenensis subsp. rotundata]|uniref:Pentatricopeptide repeat-containing protein At1g53600, mitochondrial n=1 Tax=Dioscorea cayennensis subsp. rotundata TaxID=55577 RepID=A0AB40AKC8_DIOCR|nr:pentatricopeptide repeat-containing protein At1g53600, mitochondrial [Dioscorea cayenensis subsp. rotundata]
MLIEKLSPRVSGKHLSFPALLRLSLGYSGVPLQSPSPIPESRTSVSCFTKTGRYLMLLNSEITNFGRNGNLDEARMVFDQMPFRDVVSWTAMLTAYAGNGQVVKAREVFDEMPTRNTASWNAMISAYVHDLNLSEAFELFMRMPRKNVISYSAMITGFAKSRMLREAEDVYKRMPPSWRDPVASNALIYGYLRNGEVEEAARVFNAMVMKDVISWSSMVDGYCKNGRVFDAREMFEEMPVRNVVSWTAMIHGYVKVGMWVDGLMMFSRMRREGIMINSTTLAIVLDACAEFGRNSEGIQIHGLTVRMGFGSDIFLCNSIIAMYSRAGWMLAARTVFDNMRKKDVVSWNSLITGYVQHDDIEEANALFEEMPEKDAVTWTSMVVGFSKRGWIRESVRLFEAMPEKDDVAWTAMISCFAANGEYVRAFQLFQCMLQEGLRPNPLVLSSVLSALSGLAILQQGVQVHAFIVKMELEFDSSIQSSLVSMYAKCGSLIDAFRIFSNISELTIIAVNSMITGFAQHGLAKEALRVFKEAEANGCKPNHVTFLGILSACSCAGLVEEGYHYFKLMDSCYCIEPGPDHYTCMVDLLGRAGMLKEALDLINSMPFDPNAAIWGALLNAGKVHSDLNIAKLAAQRLFELDPGNATAYAVLSNMYSLAGMKDNEEELRITQRTRGLRKNPGYSWIALDK